MVLRLRRQRRRRAPSAVRLCCSRRSRASRRGRRSSAARTRSLLVALDDLRVSEIRRGGILPRLAQRTALPEQIPRLVEAHLDRLEPAVLALAQAALRAALVQLVLLGNELLDTRVDLVVVHLEPPVDAPAMIAPRLTRASGDCAGVARNRSAMGCDDSAGTRSRRAGGCLRPAPAPVPASAGCCCPTGRGTPSRFRTGAPRAPR